MNTYTTSFHMKIQFTTSWTFGHGSYFSSLQKKHQKKKLMKINNFALQKTLIFAFCKFESEKLSVNV